jgi:hypothetical protein
MASVTLDALVLRVRPMTDAQVDKSNIPDFSFAKKGKHLHYGCFRGLQGFVG